MSRDQCNNCRFWLFAADGANGTGETDEGRPYGWGWCRRNPPQLSERMSGMLIPSLGNRDDNYDPENVATAMNVADSSLFPATWHDKWCGRHEPIFRPVLSVLDAPDDAMVRKGQSAFQSARSELREGGTA